MKTLSQKQSGNSGNGPPAPSTPAVKQGGAKDKKDKTHGAEHLQKHWWKKGQSGNPAGRPKGSISMTHQLRRMLEEGVVVKRNGKRKNVTTAEQLLEVAVKAARKGKFNFFKEIFDRMDGKVPDHVIMDATKRVIKQEAESIAAEMLQLMSTALEKHLPDDDAKVASILVDMADQLEARYVVPDEPEPDEDDE